MKSGNGDNYKPMIQESIARVSSGTHSLARLQTAEPSYFSKGTIAPGPAIGPPAKFMVSSRASKNFVKLDEDVHELLAECEQLVLIEFIECAIPMFYAVYMIILFHLPKAKYYPEMERFDATRLDHTVRNIAAYATLECLCCTCVPVVGDQHFCIASAVERTGARKRHAPEVWVIVVLQLTLQHTRTRSFLLAICACWSELTVDPM